MNVLANPIFYLQHHLRREDLAKPCPCSHMPVGHQHPGGAVPLVRQDLSSPACARPPSLLNAEPGAPCSLPLCWHFFFDNRGIFLCIHVSSKKLLGPVPLFAFLASGWSGQFSVFANGLWRSSSILKSPLISFLFRRNFLKELPSLSLNQDSVPVSQKRLHSRC